MSTEINKAKLFAKMAMVMGKVRTLEKTGRNQFDKYDYVTADAIATRLGAVMAEAQLALFPSIISVETSDYATKSGGNNFRTVVHMQMTIACGESGATWTSDWFGEAIDRSDKSISKAAVSAVKYFLLKTFLLAGGDEEDADAGSPTVDAPKATQKSQERTQATEQGDVLFTTEAKETPPHARMFAEGFRVFGDSWNNGGRKWFLRFWSKHATPDNIRESAADFNDTEKDLIADYLIANRVKLQKVWNDYKAKQAAEVQATEAVAA